MSEDGGDYRVSSNDNVIQLRQAGPTPFSISFSDDNSQMIGKLVVEGDTMVFEGEADEAAVIFFDSIIERWERRIAELKAELETSEGQRKRISGALREIATGLGKELSMVSGVISGVNEDMTP